MSTANSGHIPGHGASVTILFLLLGGTLGAWIYLVVNLFTLDASACLSLPSKVPGFGFVLPAIVGLLVGRYVGLIRYVRTWDVEDAKQGTSVSDTAGRVALAIIFGALVFIFIYEAIGVYQPANGLEPITYYVRCSISIDNAYGAGHRTMAIIFLIGLLYGQWLWAWHPARTQFRGDFRGQLRNLLHELAHKQLYDVPRKRTRPGRPPLSHGEEEHHAG